MNTIEELAWLRALAANGGARTIREAARISASEVARELDVSPSAISRWERGLRSPRGDDARRYARLLRRLMNGGRP
jgi:transcriptional regulator with XRE-family HTH domain